MPYIFPGHEDQVRTKAQVIARRLIAQLDAVMEDSDYEEIISDHWSGVTFDGAIDPEAAERAEDQLGGMILREAAKIIIDTPTHS